MSTLSSEVGREMEYFKRFKEIFIGSMIERALMPSLSKGLFERLNQLNQYDTSTNIEEMIHHSR